VRREICRITTKGTRTFGIIDGETNDAENSFLIAISEKVFIYIQTYFNFYTLYVLFIQLLFRKLIVQLHYMVFASLIHLLVSSIWGNSKMTVIAHA